MSLDSTQSPFHVIEEDGSITIHFRAGTALTDTHVETLGRRLSARDGSRRLTLDLAGVVAMSSAALGKLLALNRRVGATGGRFTLANPTPTVRRVFMLTRLDTVLDIRATEPAAV